MVRLIPYILYFLLIAAHQVFIKDLTGIFGVSINLAVLIVLLTAVYKSEMTSMWVGFLVGLTAFSGEGSLLGWHALILAVVGVVAHNIKQALNLDSLYAKMLLIVSGVFVHNLIVLLLSRVDDFFINLLIGVLAGAVYTSVIGWLYFLIREDRLTLKKFKEIF